MAIFRGTGGQGDSTTDTTVTTVTQKAAEAASSATSAANSATSAANSASSASTSATNAATSETNAATSASNASTSENNASTDASSASTSANNAANSAYNASVYRNETQTLKTQTQGFRDFTATLVTLASGHADDAETAYADTLAIFGDAQDVQDAVNSASASATTATTKASEAATSATNAANSATSAGTSETNSASSASQAATSANTAGSHATDAETAKNAAETAQAAAEAAEANINGLYLGSLANDPTLDGNGLAVGTGDLYFNTTENEVRVYTDNDEWIAVIEAGGDATFNSLTSNNDVVVKGNLEVQGTTITVDSATAQTIDLGDNDKIRFGDGDDLQIYHDGTKSYINDQGTGNLLIQATNLKLQDADGDNYVVCLRNGAVSLFYDGSKKLETTSTGIDVTGTVTADDEIIVDGASGAQVTIRDTGRNGLQLSQNSTGGGFIDLVDATENLHIRTQSTNNIRIQSSGDISFYDDAGTSQDLYWDASTSRLGLGTTTPSATLDVNGIAKASNLQATASVRIDANNPQFHIVETTGSADQNFSIRVSGGNLQFRQANDALNSFTLTQQIKASGDIVFYDDSGSSQDFYWDASTSRLGLGTTSPAEELHISASVPKIQIQDSDGTNQYGQYYHSAGSTAILSRNGNADGQILFQRYDGTTTDESMRINSSGNVGIGTSSPGLTSAFVNKVLSVSGNTRGGLELIGNTATDTLVSILSFHNLQSTDTGQHQIVFLSSFAHC